MRNLGAEFYSVRLWRRANPPIKFLFILPPTMCTPYPRNHFHPRSNQPVHPFLLLLGTLPYARSLFVLSLCFFLLLFLPLKGFPIGEMARLQSTEKPSRTVHLEHVLILSRTEERMRKRGKANEKKTKYIVRRLLLSGTDVFFLYFYSFSYNLYSSTPPPPFPFTYEALNVQFRNTTIATEYIYLEKNLYTIRLLKTFLVKKNSTSFVSYLKL